MICLRSAKYVKFTFLSFDKVYQTIYLFIELNYQEDSYPRPYNRLNFWNFLDFVFTKLSKINKQKQ